VSDLRVLCKDKNVKEERPGKIAVIRKPKAGQPRGGACQSGGRGQRSVVLGFPQKRKRRGSQGQRSGKTRFIKGRNYKKNERQIPRKCKKCGQTTPLPGAPPRTGGSSITVDPIAPTPEVQSQKKEVPKKRQLEGGKS